MSEKLTFLPESLGADENPDQIELAQYFTRIFNKLPNRSLLAVTLYYTLFDQFCSYIF
jgi:hypothetical protein